MRARTAHVLPVSTQPVEGAAETNAIERLHREFRRRVKTQGALPTAQADELLLFALLLTGLHRTRATTWQAG